MQRVTFAHRSVVFGVVLAGCAGIVLHERSASRGLAQDLIQRSEPPPAYLATWPWTDAAVSDMRPGVRHWFARSPDGTDGDLFDFDFAANPRLRLEMYDQDQDDDRPFDNRVHYWPNGVGQVTKRLNAEKHGIVVAAWNGLFFDLDGQTETSTASHLTPVVLDSHLHYADLPTYRWTFGVKYVDGAPRFDVIHMPSASELPARFTYCAGAAQCVVREGKPLKLQPFPMPGAPIPKANGSTDQEAGYIRFVDHMKVSRVSLGWSKDSRHLYLLFIKAPTTETESGLAMKHNASIAGGWTLEDVQKFWLAHGAWTAINSDGGGPAQLAFRSGANRYDLVPPRWAADNKRMTFDDSFHGAPEGGSLMYFYVREDIAR